MSNADDIAGIQFDLSYPDQISYINQVISGERFTDHEIEVEFLDPILRILIYSPSLTPISGNSGTVLTLGFYTEPVLGDFEIEFFNPVLANTDYENVLTSYENGMITLDSPVPLLAPFLITEIFEDSSYIIYQDDLRAHVSDVDTPIDEITFTLQSTYLAITNFGDNYIVQPPQNWHGIDTVWVTSNDGFYYDEEPWPFHVINVNDPPVLSEIANIEFNEDTQYTINLDSIVTDVDDDLSDMVWEVEASSENINTVLDIETNVIAIVPEQDFFGSGIEISFVVQDTSLASDTVITLVSVLPINDPPIFVSTLPDISFEEDSVFSLPLAEMVWAG